MPALLDSLQVLHAASFGWAMACCAWQQDLAEDVLQEAYLRVLDGRAKYAGKSTRKTWFFAVIRHVAADMQRTQKRHSVLNLRMLVDDRSALEAPDKSLNEQLYQGQASQRLSHGLLQLSVRQREVLHLTFYAELTLEDAAATLGISVGSARTHYHRGKERLAQLLELDQGND